MKILNLILAGLCCVLLLACEEDEPEGADVDTVVRIAVVDADGNDLLDPANSSAFQEEDITISYLIDGEAKVVNEPMMDASKGFYVEQNGSTGQYAIQIFLNNSKTEEFPITYIHWNETDTDTLKCEYERTANSVVCTKVWFNDEVKWEAYETARSFEIVK